MHALTVGLQVGLVVAVVVSLLVLRYLDTDLGARVAKLRRRLLFGIPVGTVVSILVVVGVYLFVQQGFWHPYAPLTIPFTSWSYLYPLGALIAPFAHQGIGHLTGNLIGFGVFGAIAEYAFGHYPTTRGHSAFGDRLSNPYIRGLILFPAGVILTAWLTSIFAWGPIIGFSGVVFAAAGFALIRYPMLTVVALVGREFVGTLYYTVRQPITYGEAAPSFGPPWWAGIAIQGHLLGFLAGVLLAVIVITGRKPSERPSSFRVWLGTLIAGSSLTLWALWWYRGSSSYVLYRGPGLLMLLALAVLFASVVRATERPLFEGISRRQVAIGILVLPLLTMGFVAVPLNLTTLQDGEVPGDSVSIRGYEVTYAEDVTNRRIGAIDISFLGETTQVNSSGVIVVSEDRQIWDESVPSGRLGTFGGAAVTVGGIGWRETVDVRRQGWQVSGGGTAYVISLGERGTDLSPVYASDPVTAAPIIAGRNVTLVPQDGRFLIAVQESNLGEDEGLPATAEPMPAVNESVAIGGLNFTRRETTVYASRNDTRVPIFQAEEYER